MAPPTVSFENIGGLNVQKSYLQSNIIDVLADPNAAQNVGLNPPRGVLFYGVPGSGKTLLGTALATELTKRLNKPVNFIFRKGADTFSPWLGESSKNLKHVFDEAIALKPSVIFFDELDGLCPSRDRAGSCCQSYTTVVTTFLGLMDSLPKGEVFVIGATNRLESIDAAVLRPGRMDKKLCFLPPDEAGREQIININLKSWESQQRPSQLYVKQLSRQTVGFTGADLQKLCRDAFYEAFCRHNPGRGLGGEKLNADNLKVLESDWNAAFMKITPTDTKTFGSLLYIPMPVHITAAPILHSSSADIVKVIEMMEPILSQGKTLFGKLSSDIKAVLIRDEKNKTGFVLDNLIIPNVLANKKLTMFPIYMINKETAGTNTFLDAVQQAANFSPSILVVLRVDRLNDTGSNKDDLLYREMHTHLRGKPVLVLATASSKASIKSEALKNMFQSHIVVGTPSEKERAELFRPIFLEMALQVNDEALKAQVKATDRKNAEELLQQCIKTTDGYSISSLLNLQGLLSRKCVAHFDSPQKDQLFNSLKISVNTSRNY